MAETVATVGSSAGRTMHWFPTSRVSSDPGGKSGLISSVSG
jgi:hypothetical protein